MIEVEIPKDITKYNSKLIGPLSGRELVGGSIALATGFIVYNVLKNIGIQGDVAGFLTMISAIPGIAIGWIKIYGEPFEQFAKLFFQYNVLAPPTRRYHSVTSYERVYDLIEKHELEKDKNKAKKHKQIQKLQAKKPKMKKHKKSDYIGYL